MLIANQLVNVLYSFFICNTYKCSISLNGYISILLSNIPIFVLSIRKIFILYKQFDDFKVHFIKLYSSNNFF